MGSCARLVAFEVTCRFILISADGAAVRTSLSHSPSMPKRFQIEMPFAPPPSDRAMLDVHSLSAAADLVFIATCHQSAYMI